MDNYSPIILFTYNRIKSLQITIEALKNNIYAANSELFIFSDGAKGKFDEKEVSLVRNYLKTISGFKNISIYESSNNKGLANWCNQKV